MKPTIYTLEALVETFKKHAIKADTHRRTMVKSFFEANPNFSLPAHMKDDFNIAKALGFMCEKLQQIENRLDEIDEWMKWAEKELEKE